MNRNLKKLINFWSYNLAAEQTSDRLQKICADIDVEPLWIDLARRQWLRQGESGQYGLAPQALRFAEHNDQRIAHHEALEIVRQMRCRIQIWNRYAHYKGLPSVAATAVWGSVARPYAADHGDVDVCLVWRRPWHSNKTNIKTCPVVAPVQCDETNRWEIEDTVEQWIADHPLINISGVDQWEEFGDQNDFFARLVFADKRWKEGDNTGVSEIEAQTMRTFAKTWLEMTPKCVKIHKRQY